MDPIHPIVPQAPIIPPVMPATIVGRIDRDGRQRGDGQGSKGRRRPSAPQDVGEDDDTGLHIDVTA
jgi:hypothetical protein